MRVASKEQVGGGGRTRGLIRRTALENSRPLPAAAWHDVFYGKLACGWVLCVRVCPGGRHHKKKSKTAWCLKFRVCVSVRWESRLGERGGCLHGSTNKTAKQASRTSASSLKKCRILTASQSFCLSHGGEQFSSPLSVTPRETPATCSLLRPPAPFRGRLLARQ